MARQFGFVLLLFLQHWIFEAAAEVLDHQTCKCGGAGISSSIIRTSCVAESSRLVSLATVQTILADESRGITSSLPVVATSVKNLDMTTASEGKDAATVGLHPMRKKGIAYNDDDLANNFREQCSSCTRAYNWASSANGLSPELAYVPMLWGDTQLHTGDWKFNVTEAISAGSQAILGFNEPDRADQANISPDRAASSHIEHLNPYNGMVMIGSPAVTNSVEPGQGLQWLLAFFEACSRFEQGCAVDFCAVHWYSQASIGHDQLVSDLFKHLEGAYEACGRRPIWLTEFAVHGTTTEIQTFLQAVIPKLEETDFVAAYFYFWVSIGSLMMSQNSPSIIGEAYASLS